MNDHRVRKRRLDSTVCRLFHACLMLPRTGVYAYLDPSGPRAGPMLMLRVFVLAFGVMVAITSADVGLFTIVAGSGS